MFDQTFVDHAQTTKEPFALAASVLLESFAVGLLILIPLIYTQALPSAQLKSLLTAPPPPPAPTPKPVGMKQQHVVAAHTFSMLTAPTVIPKQINPEIRTEPDIAIPGGTSQASGTVYSVVPGVLFPIPTAPPPAPPAKPKASSKPIRVGVGVAEANLIHKVLPVYPALAKSARVQGTVEFTAIISKEGTIENLRLVHGHPLLVQAAREAVLQWKYRPTLLNGEPVEVVTDIIVNFTLSQ
ncbi:MAG TPA: energy transducer TonB [Bryobacteraceae bacterium]|jgi:protein TonB|nr:energy transducer TonB [Bryobacteraceae bacterium]